MPANCRRRLLTGYAPALVFSVLFLAVFLILFFSRSLDDNRLTSWQDVFTIVDPGNVILLLTAGIAAAFVFSGSALAERRPALFLFAVSCAAGAIFWREPEVIVDASRYFTEAKHLELYGAGYFIREWGGAIPAWTDMPVVPFLYGLIFRFFGETRLYIEIFNTLLFSLTVLLTYLTGRELWDDAAGFFGGMLLLGVPYIFSQLPLMLADLPSVFLIMLSIFTFLRAIQRGGPMIFASAVAVFAAFFSKYSNWLMLTILPVVLLVYCIGCPFRERKGCLLRGSATLVTAAILIAFFFIYKYDVISQQMRLLIEFQKPGLRRWGESYISTFLFQTSPWITAAAVYSLYRAIRQRDLRYLIVLWLPALFLALRVERIRYTLPAFPMICLAASFGMMDFGRKETVKFIVLCVAVSSIVIAASAYLPFLERLSLVNIGEAGAFLDRLEGRDIEVYTPPKEHTPVNPAVAVPLLDLFTDKTIHYDYTMNFPRSRGILESPLRFTFEYRNPGYYSTRIGEEMSAVVVIAENPGHALPPAVERRVGTYRRMKVFGTSDNVFDYQTIVTIYY